MNETLGEGWEDNKSFEMDNKWIFSQNMKKIAGTVEINIKKSYDKNYKLQIKKDSRGVTEEYATELANKIIYGFTVQNDTLKLDSYYKLEENSPWRMQKVHVTLFVPENKAVYLGDSTSEYLYDVDNIENIYDRDMSGHTWLMKKEGLSWSIEK